MARNPSQLILKELNKPKKRWSKVNIPAALLFLALGAVFLFVLHQVVN